MAVSVRVRLRHAWRMTRHCAVVLPGVYVRLARTLARHAWTGRLTSSIIGLSLEEENRVRLLRVQVAHYTGLPSISVEELIMILPVVLRVIVAGAPAPSRSDLCRLLTGRRRYRPVREAGGDMP